MPRREQEIFLAALELPAPQRAGYLARECVDDEKLRGRVEGLLAAADSAGDFLGGHEAEIGEQAGTKIDAYTLLEKIGEGGFGVVYRAEQQQPVRRTVAFKIIKLGMDTRAVVTRFEAERQALALMDHPNIARVFDGGATESGRPYFVMEFVAGQPITTFCREQRLPLAARLTLFIQVCRAVQHAHQKGVIHRDLKPSNMLVTHVDGRAVVKVIDFGIAKATREPLTAHTVVSRLFLFVGTPSYMSPEQLMPGAAGVDTRSDVFALGAVLHELLVDAPPLPAQDVTSTSYVETERCVREATEIPASRRLRALSPEAQLEIAAARGCTRERLLAHLRGDLDQIVLKCLAVDRARRYDSAEDLARDLECYLRGDPVTAQPATLAYRLGKFARRNTAAIAITATTALSVAAIVGYSAFRLARERDLAQRSAWRAEGVSALLMAQLGTSDPYHVPKPSEQADLLSRVRSDFAGDPAIRLDILSQVGRVLLRRGQNIPAQAVLEEALVAGREVGRPLPFFGQALNDLGVLHRERADYVTARRFLEEAVEVRHRLVAEVGLGDEAVSLVELGRNHLALEEYERAEALYQQALRLRQEAFGAEHSEIATSLGDLANAEWMFGHLENALALGRQCHEMFRRTVGENQPNFSTSQAFLARILAETGDLTGAERMLRESLDRLRRVLGPHHWRTVRVAGFLGGVLRQQGRIDEAEQYARDAYVFFRDLPGGDPTLLAQAEVDLARVLLLRDDARSAETLLRSALARQERLFPAHSWRVAATKSLLGEALLRQRRWGDAEPLLLAAKEILPDLAGPRGAETKSNRERLARLQAAKAAAAPH